MLLKFSYVLDRVAALKPEYVFLLVGLPIVFLVALMTPIGAGCDEEAHIYRVYQISKGNFISDPVGEVPKELAGVRNTLWGGGVDSNLVDVLEINGKRYANPEADQRRYPLPPWSMESSGDGQFLSGDEVFKAFSNTAVYSPVVYIPYVIGFWIAEALNFNIYGIVVFLRFTGLIFYFAVGFLVLRYSVIASPFMFALLLPNILLSVSTVTADCVNNAFCIALIALVLSLCLRDAPPSKSQLIILALLAIAISLSKIVYVLLIILLILLPIMNKAFVAKKNLLWLAGVLFLSFLAFSCWFFIVKDVNTGTMFVQENVRTVMPEVQVAHLLENPLSFALVLFNSMLNTNFFSFGELDFIGARFAEPKSCSYLVILLLILVTVDWKEYSASEDIYRKIKPLTMVFVFVFMILALAVHLALYLQFTSPGLDIIRGVQPRYFAVALPLLLCPVALAARSLQYSFIEKSESKATTAVVLVRRNLLAIALFLLLFQDFVLAAIFLQSMYLY